MAGVAARGGGRWRTLERPVRIHPSRTLLWLGMCALALSTLYPPVFLLTTSLKGDEEYAADRLGLPEAFSLHNFTDAWERTNFGQLALNSFVVVGASVLAIAVLATLAGFALGLLRVPAGRLVHFSIVMLMMIPPSVALIPTLQVVLDLGLVNTHLGLIAVYVGLNLPFSIYMMSAYFESLPRELLHAARVDGATMLQLIRHVYVPLARPALLAMVTLNVIFLWNELLFALVIIQDPQKRTLMPGLAVLQGQLGNFSIPVLAAVSLLSLIPVVIVILLFQRRLHQGLAVGAVK